MLGCANGINISLNNYTFRQQNSLLESAAGLVRPKSKRHMQLTCLICPPKCKEPTDLVLIYIYICPKAVISKANNLRHFCALFISLYE